MNMTETMNELARYYNCPLQVDSKDLNYTIEVVADIGDGGLIRVCDIRGCSGISFDTKTEMEWIEVIYQVNEQFKSNQIEDIKEKIKNIEL